MALELAFLVIDRAPYTGDNFRMLLHLALKADDADRVHVYSSRALGRSTRLAPPNALAALAVLKRDKYLLNRHVGERRGEYFIARELLLGFLPRERAVKKFAGQPVHLIGPKAQAGLTALLEARRTHLVEALSGARPRG